MNGNLKFVDKIKEVFMKKLLAMMALSVGLMVNAQTVDLLKPSKEIALRAPSGAHCCFRSIFFDLVSL